MELTADEIRHALASEPTAGVLRASEAGHEPDNREVQSSLNGLIAAGQVVRASSGKYECFDTLANRLCVDRVRHRLEDAARRSADAGSS